MGKILTLQASNRKIWVAVTVLSFRFIRHSFEFLFFGRSISGGVFFKGWKTWPDAVYHAATKRTCASVWFACPKKYDAVIPVEMDGVDTED